MLFCNMKLTLYNNLYHVVAIIFPNDLVHVSKQPSVFSQAIIRFTISEHLIFQCALKIIPKGFLTIVLRLWNFLYNTKNTGNTVHVYCDVIHVGNQCQTNHVLWLNHILGHFRASRTKTPPTPTLSKQFIPDMTHDKIERLHEWTLIRRRGEMTRTQCTRDSWMNK